VQNGKKLKKNEMGARRNKRKMKGRRGRKRGFIGDPYKGQGREDTVIDSA
jgi:hypothetical protein